jgi:hypothetical protein
MPFAFVFITRIVANANAPPPHASLITPHLALSFFAQDTRMAVSARSIGFCIIWVCISLEFEFH